MQRIIDKEEYVKIWNDFNSMYNFNQAKWFDKKYDEIFTIKHSPYKIFIIDDVVCEKEEWQRKVNEILKKVINKDMYAIDWQHEIHIFNPHENITLEQSGWGENFDNYIYEGFPCYYPDGDDFFFITKDFREGILCVPGFGKTFALIYVVGQELIDEFSISKKKLDLYNYDINKMLKYKTKND